MVVDPTFLPIVDSSDPSFLFNFAGGPPDGVNDYDGAIAANPLVILQIASNPTTVIYTIKYTNVETKVYEGFIHIAVPSGGADPTNPKINLKVEVFGTIIFDDSFDATTIAGINFKKTIEFSFMYTGTTSLVVITYTTEVTAAYNNYIQFGLLKHDQVLNSADECVEACPIEPGFTVGANNDLTPPICVYCSDSLFQFFNPYTKSCDCVPGRVIISGMCTPCDNPLCKICDPTQLSVCLECMENAEVLANCECIDGYYPFDNSIYMECK